VEQAVRTKVVTPWAAPAGRRLACRGAAGEAPDV